MTGINSFVDVLERIIAGVRSVANLGRPQLIKQIDAVRLNLEQFKQAALDDDQSKMRELLAECEELSDALETRLLKVLDDKKNTHLRKAVRRARVSKSGMVRRPERAPTSAEVRRALNAKGIELADAIDAGHDSNRQQLLADLDDAIGRLRGISKSLESFSL